jgi:hypothetical protein
MSCNPAVSCNSTHCNLCVRLYCPYWECFGFRADAWLKSSFRCVLVQRRAPGQILRVSRTKAALSAEIEPTLEVVNKHKGFHVRGNADVLGLPVDLQLHN